MKISAIRDNRDHQRADDLVGSILPELQKPLGKADGHERIVPVCSYCLKIRGHTGQWHGTTIHDHRHSDYRFSHGICPDCEKDLYLQLSQRTDLAVMNP